MDWEKGRKYFKTYPAFRLKQAERAVFGDFIESWDEATVFPKDLREMLNQKFPLEIDATIFASQDGKTKKALITLDDNEKIETVLMRHADKRNTICVSSQVGCSLGCLFCATGKLKWHRDLTSDEIVAQVLFFARLLKKHNERVTNVVFMGMGEPFLNYDNVLAAIRELNDKNKFNIGARKISVSTSGIPEGIKKFTEEKLQINLALSLHAPNDELRKKIMPIARRYSLPEVLQAVSEYIEKTGRQVMIEYLLLNNVNDSEKQAKELAVLLRKHLRRLYLVNLISYNITGKKFKPAEKKHLERFKKILLAEEITVTQRYRFGQDIEAACGQLAALNKS